MATVIRLKQSITDESAPRLPEIITSHSFDDGVLSMTDAAMGGTPWAMTNVSNAWKAEAGGITSTGGSLALNGLPSDLSVSLTVKSLPSAGRFMLSSRSDSISGANREVVEIQYDGAVRLNPRVAGAQYATSWTSAGVVQPGSKVGLVTVGGTVCAVVDGSTVISRETRTPTGGVVYLSSFQLGAGLVLDDLFVTTA